MITGEDLDEMGYYTAYHNKELTLNLDQDKARALDVTLSEVASINLNKLEDRAKRGVLKGSGDKR